MRSLDTETGLRSGLAAILAAVLAAVFLVAFAARAGLILDDSFRPAATTTQGTVLFAVAVQSDGKVLIAGDFALVNGVPRRSVARLLSDGSLDLSFDAGLGVDGLIYALAVQPLDGKVLVVGRFTGCHGARRSSLARLNPDGTLDAGFNPVIEGPEGWLVSSVALQPDGRIVIGGNFDTLGGLPRRGLARLTSSGAIDRTFDPGSGLEGGTAHDLALEGNGRILVGGTFARVGGLPRAGLARLYANGRTDPSFDCSVYSGEGPGRVFAISVDPVHGIVVAGAFDRVGSDSRAGVARLSFDGAVDLGFDPQGGVMGGANAPYDLLALPGGKVMLTGSFWYAGGAERAGVARLDPSGSADAAFNPGSGLSASGEAFGNMLAAQADGRVIVAGQFEEAGGIHRHCVARFYADGTVDPTFSSTNSFLEFAGTVRAIRPLADGGAFVGGDFERVNGHWRHGLAQLAPGGGLVTAFDAQLNPGAVIHAIEVQPDGKVLVGGWFERAAESELSNLARLLPNGALDESFAGHGADAAVHALVLHPDGRILVAGEFRQFDDLRRFGLMRLEADGEPDLAFEPRFEIGLDRAAVLAIAVQPDGRLLVGGYFDSVNGQTRRAIARIQPDGTLDEEFDAGVLGQNVAPLVTSIALRGDGRFILGGHFSMAAGHPRQGLTRLYADGGLDASFNPGFGVGGPEVPAVEALALLTDGQLAVGGDFASFNTQSTANLVLLTTLGSSPSSPVALDPPEGPVHAAEVQADGSLIVGGEFSRVHGQTRLGLARFTALPATPEARVAITSEGEEIRIHWDGPGRLFETEEPAGPWRESTDATSPHTESSLLGSRFYRLVE